MNTDDHEIAMAPDARSALFAGPRVRESVFVNPQALAMGGAVLLLPGTILSVELWLGINTAISAREPSPSEHHLGSGRPPGSEP